MVGRTFADISLKHVDMRCEDYYGRRPERDGPILVGIFIGESLILRLIFAMVFNVDSGNYLEMKTNVPISVVRVDFYGVFV